MAFQTPILFLIFNRPDTTKQVFAKIREVKPKYLYVAADGPRSHKEGEKELCEQTRKIVTDNIDWDCELVTLFREENLGCGKAVSGAITWFFENVEQGIILEDDIMVSQDFFFFCSELLQVYKDNVNVFSITGSNFQDGRRWGNESYYFTRYAYIWGWATWKRAWEKYDYEMKGLSDFISNKEIEKIFSRTHEQQFWLNHFAQAKNIDTWDFQWMFTILKNNGYSVTPNYNLTRNIGFGPNATHTKTENTKISSFKLETISDIKHHSRVEVNVMADNYTFDNYYCSTSDVVYETLGTRIIKKIKNFFNLHL